VSITYACGQCGAVDCKLWRPMSVLANEVELVCWKCLEAKGHAVRLNDADPRYRSDQVYTPEIEHTCYSPAVPDLDGSWWGYTMIACTAADQGRSAGVSTTACFARELGLEKTRNQKRANQRKKEIDDYGR